MIEDLKFMLLSAHQGYSKAPEIQQKYFQTRYAVLEQHRAELEQMFSEPYLVTEYAKKTIEEWMYTMVTTGETFICKDGDSVLGFLFLYFDTPAKATLLAWIAPAYRGGANDAREKTNSFLNENIFPYAWGKLGLVRIETRCSVKNGKAVKFAERIGFQHIGIARLDFKSGNELSDTVILEMVNPAYEVPPVEEIPSGKFSKSEPEPDPSGDGRSESAGSEQLPWLPGRSSDDSIDRELRSVPELPGDNGEGGGSESSVQRGDGGGGSALPEHAVQRRYGSPAWRSGY